MPRHQIVFLYSLLGVHFLYSGLLLLPLPSQQLCSFCSSSTSRLFPPRVNDNASRGDVQSIKELPYLQACLFSFLSVFSSCPFHTRSRKILGRVSDSGTAPVVMGGRWLRNTLPPVNNITSVAGCFPSAFSILKNYGRNSVGLWFRPRSPYADFLLLKFQAHWTKSQRSCPWLY